MPSTLRPPSRPASAGTPRKAASGTDVAPRLNGYAVDAHADPVDFRDRLYVPTLTEVGTHRPMDAYLQHQVPVLDQGREGACTGFALATVAHWLLRTRRTDPDPTPVSPHMLYRMARQHDEWPGENYSGSSARGAMKGWHKHGVCTASAWPARPPRGTPPGLNTARANDALKRPLGAYFRVNHRDLVALHTALTEVGILFATASVHEGWDKVRADGVIPWRSGNAGGHAFAIVAYDRGGFWLQNSWGKGWGREGFGYLSYDDWLANASDVWVARLGVPVELSSRGSVAMGVASASAGASRDAQHGLRPHIVSVDNEGLLQRGGDFGMDAADLARIFSQDVAQSFTQWGKPRVLLYAHGGLVGETAAVQRISEYVSPLMAAQIYPLAFVWHSDYWSTLTHILQDALSRRRSEGALDAAKDFLLDRVDDALEPLARVATGRASWKEMKENAVGCSRRGHAAELVVRQLQKLQQQWPDLEVHLVAHSAGAVLQGALLPVLARAGLKVNTCTLWAPACTMAFFEQSYVTALDQGTLERLAVYALDDQSEQDDHCARIYNKSLLYLVAHAFEDRPRVPWLRPAGTPLLGMQKFHDGNAALQRLLQAGRLQLVIGPNNLPVGDLGACRARAHGDFDDDEATVRGSFARILQGRVPAAKAAAAVTVAKDAAPLSGGEPDGTGGSLAPKVHFGRSATSLQAQRKALDSAR